MRGLAKPARRAKKVKVRYVGIEDEGNTGSLLGEVQAGAGRAATSTSVVVTAPGEYRLMEAFETFAAESNVPFQIREDDRYLCERAATSPPGRTASKQLRMELFYREMRKRYNDACSMPTASPKVAPGTSTRRTARRMPKRF